MSTTILVTGATGTIGAQLVSALSGRPDVSVRAAVRSIEKATNRTNVTHVELDYAKPQLIAAALHDVDKVFLITPFTPDQVEIGERLIDAGKSAGVKHVVKLSAIGADIEPGIQLGRWHRAVEKHLEASGIAWTILRPNNFFENFIGYYPPQKDGNIYLPFGAAAVSFIAGSDIAAVAAVALTSSGHEGKAYELTGPAAITVAEVADTLGKVTGRKIAYVDTPEDTARKAMLDSGAPAWMVDAMMELHGIDKAGYAATVGDTVPKLLGRAAISFREFAQKNANVWRS